MALASGGVGENLARAARKICNGIGRYTWPFPWLDEFPSDVV